MTAETAETADREGPPVAAVVTVAFATIVTLTLSAYFLAVNLIDWATVTHLAYPADEVAPFVVITGAILTIPIMIPTALVTMRSLR